MVTVGRYSPRRIGNSRIVPAVLTRYLQSSPITCRARQSPTGPARHSELPGKLRHLRHQQSPPVRPGRPFRNCRPCRPDPKTDGLDAREHCHRLLFRLLKRRIRMDRIGECSCIAACTFSHHLVSLLRECVVSKERQYLNSVMGSPILLSPWVRLVIAVFVYLLVLVTPGRGNAVV